MKNIKRRRIMLSKKLDRLVNIKKICYFVSRILNISDKRSCIKDLPHPTALYHNVPAQNDALIFEAFYKFFIVSIIKYSFPIYYSEIKFDEGFSLPDIVTSIVSMRTNVLN